TCGRHVEGTSDATASSRFMIAEAQRRSPMRLGFLSPARRHQPVRVWAPNRSGLPRAGATHGCEFELHVSNQNDVSARVSGSASRRTPGLPTRRIKAWLDENCGANEWALKKAALEQSA